MQQLQRLGEHKAHVTIATLEQDAFTQGAALLKRLAWASEVSVIGHAGAA